MKDNTTYNDDQLLKCPHCKSRKIEPRKTTIKYLDGRIIVGYKSEQQRPFDPIKEDYKPDMVIVDTDTSTNKLNDPYAISTDFYCEKCKSYSKMIFSDYFFTTRLGGEKSVHIDKKDDTKEDV